MNEKNVKNVSMSVTGKKSLQNALHEHEQVAVQHFTALHVSSQHHTTIHCTPLKLGGAAGQNYNFRLTVMQEL